MPDTCHANHRKLNADCQHPDHPKELAAKSYRSTTTYSAHLLTPIAFGSLRRLHQTQIGHAHHSAADSHNRQPQYTTGVKPMNIADAITADAISEAIAFLFTLIYYLGH